jgi:chemotaxis protein CheD
MFKFLMFPTDIKYKMSNLYVDIKNRSTDVQMQNALFPANPVSVMTAVNFSELKISANTAETLVAFSIGSGIGVSMHDAVAKVGGLLNFVLPDSSKIWSERENRFPYMFADTGLLAFLEALNDVDAKTKRLKVVIAGGAQILDQTSDFNIGLKNHQALISILSRKNLTIQHEDIGGSQRRTLCLDIDSGCSTIQTAGQGEVRV